MNQRVITLSRFAPTDDGWKLFVNGVDTIAGWVPWETVKNLAIMHNYDLPYKYWIADGNGNYGYLKP